MPVIDKAQIPQQQLGALPGPKIGTRVTPGQVGSTLQRVGMAGLDMATEIQIEEDEVATKALDVEFSKALREHESKYLSMYGQNAYEGHSEYQKGLETLKNEYLGRATTPRQKKMFGDVAERRYASASQTGSNHQRREFKSWSDEVSEARAEEMGQEAIQNRFDYGHVRQSINTGIEELRVMGQRNGWGADVLENKIGAYKAAVHAKVVEAHLDSNNVGAAQHYFDTFGKQVDEADPVVAAKIRKSLEAESIDADAQMIAEAGFNFRNANGDIDPEAGRAWIRKNYSGKREKRAIEELNRRVNENVNDQRLRDQQLIASGEEKIVQGGGWGDLTQAEKAAFGIAGEKSVRALEAQRSKGSTPATDWGVYFPLRERLLSDDPNVVREAAAEATYVNLSTKLAPSQMQMIQDLAASATGKKGKSGSSFYNSVRTAKSVIDKALETADIEKGDKKYDEIYQRIERDIWAQAEVQQAKLEPPQVQALVARHFRDYLYEANSMWTSRARPDEIAVDGVPQEYMDDILDAIYRRIGDKPVTSEMIRSVYNEGMR